MSLAQPLSVAPGATGPLSAVLEYPAFRQTRQGRAFSPWSASFGIPLHAPQDFDLQAGSTRATEELSQLLDAMEESAPAPCVSSPPASPPREQVPGACASLHARNDEAPRPPAMPLGAAATNGEEAPRTPATPFGAAATNCARVALPTKSKPFDSMTKELYHAKHRAKRRRMLARARAALTSGAVDALGHALKAVAIKRRAEAKVIRLDQMRGADASQGTSPPRSFQDSKQPAVGSGYTARRVKATAADRRPVSLEELLKDGFELVPWDGRTPRPLVDRDGTVFAVLAGRPKDSTYEDATREAASLLDDARLAHGVSGAAAGHRRGAYPCITTGISYGGGQTYPRRFGNSDRVQRIADGLVSSPSIERLAHFGSSALRLFAPRLHGYYKATLDGLCQRSKVLTPLFARSAFAACTFNLGPQTVTYIHTDGYNLPWGWCAVTALGDFDPKQGGHIVLWDMRMVIEFPPGATILLPSAVLRHSNTRLRDGEARFSFTQYTAGGLFRWADCGHRSKKDYDKSQRTGNGCEKAAPPWGEDGLQMLSKWAEFADSHEL